MTGWWVKEEIDKGFELGFTSSILIIVTPVLELELFKNLSNFSFGTGNFRMISTNAALFLAWKLATSWSRPATVVKKCATFCWISGLFKIL